MQIDGLEMMGVNLHLESLKTGLVAELRNLKHGKSKFGLVWEDVQADISI